MRPIFSWAVLHSGSFNPQILRLSCSRYPIPTTEYLSKFCTCPYRLREAFWETCEAFRDWLSLWQKRHTIEIPPSKLLWMREWFHVPCAHRLWNCTSLRLIAIDNGASKYLSSWSLLIQCEIGLSLYSFSLCLRFDWMISSCIFWSHIGLSPQC